MESDSVYILSNMTTHSKRFFTADPDIRWSKVLCPVCNEPTGPKSKCYENPPADIPIHKRKLMSKQAGITPIYSLSCAFRKTSLWEVIINYPVSKPLVDKLRSIKGVDGIIPIKVYTFQVAISEIFDEAIVKQEINICFKTFIKHMQGLECDTIMGETDIKIEPKYQGIVFPNGQEWKPVYADDSEATKISLLAESLLDDLPDAKGIIFSERTGKKAS